MEVLAGGLFLCIKPKPDRCERSSAAESWQWQPDLTDPRWDPAAASLCRRTPLGRSRTRFTHSLLQQNQHLVCPAAAAAERGCLCCSRTASRIPGLRTTDLPPGAGEGGISRRNFSRRRSGVGRITQCSGKKKPPHAESRPPPASAKLARSPLRGRRSPRDPPRAKGPPPGCCHHHPPHRFTADTGIQVSSSG